MARLTFPNLHLFYSRLTLSTLSRQPFDQAMSLLDISNAVFEHFTGLPTKEYFLKKRVVPAKDDDKYNNNRCVQCWDEYREDHPGVKISPCGHVFGRDCLKDIVNGPTGDLCPYCRVKLFKSMPTTGDILKPIGLALMHGLFAYYDMLVGVKMQIDDFVSIHTNEYPILHPMVALASGGLAPVAELFVRNYTGVCARNPTLNVTKFFESTTLLTYLLPIWIPSAPFYLPVYFLFGTKAFRILCFVANLTHVVSSQAAHCGYSARTEAAEDVLAKGFKHESDRALLAFIAAIAIAFQKLCILALLWPVSTLNFAWTVLASIVWR